MGIYIDYIERIAPSYLKTENGLKFLRAFSEVAEELRDDMVSGRKEAMIQECSNDSLSAHFNNTYTIPSPFKTPLEEKEYLAGLFDNIWKQNGNTDHLIEELKRFGFLNAKILTWTDLVKAGVPSAFGGNYTKIVGMDPNGGLWYLPNAKKGGPGFTIEHKVLGNNHPLSVHIDVPLKKIWVELQTNGAGVPISTAKEIFYALDNDNEIKDYVFFLWQGTGAGVAASSALQTLSFAYYTYYIINIYEPHSFVSLAYWNQNGIFWNDGSTIWDGIVPAGAPGLAGILREVIRRASPCTMSCRFVRVFTNGVSSTFPVADQWEEDENGNIVDFYTTSY